MNVNSLTSLDYASFGGAGDAQYAASSLEKDAKKTEDLLSKLSAAQNKSDKEMMDACRGFESYFMQIMFREMRKTTAFEDASGPFARSSGEHIFQDMMDEQVSINAANNGGIGLAAFMYKQMKTEAQSIPAALYTELKNSGLLG